MAAADPGMDGRSGATDRISEDLAMRVPALAGGVQVLVGVAHCSVHMPENEINVHV